MKKKDYFINIEGKAVKVSEEVYREYYKGERKERYIMKDLKTERVVIDSKKGEVTIIRPARIHTKGSWVLTHSFPPLRMTWKTRFCGHF